MNVNGRVRERLSFKKKGERGSNVEDERGGRRSEGLTFGARDVLLFVQFSDFSYSYCQ